MSDRTASSATTQARRRSSRSSARRMPTRPRHVPETARVGEAPRRETPSLYRSILACSLDAEDRYSSSIVEAPKRR